MVAALKEPVEDSEEENEDNIETEGDGPLWQLFDQLYNASNALGKFKVPAISRKLNGQYGGTNKSLACVHDSQ